MNKIICEYCYQPIAHADVSKMSIPPKPEDFKSLAPDNGVPAPFHPSLEWKYFKCPYCHLRPFYDHEHVSVVDDRGNRTRLKIEPQMYKCDECGKEYKHQSSLIRHRRENHE